MFARGVWSLNKVLNVWAPFSGSLSIIRVLTSASSACTLMMTVIPVWMMAYVESSKGARGVKLRIIGSGECVLYRNL